MRGDEKVAVLVPLRAQLAPRLVHVLAELLQANAADHHNDKGAGLANVPIINHWGG